MFIIMVSFFLYVIYMALIDSSKAEKIADDILSLNDKILSVSLRDWRGNFLAVKSRESFKERFLGVNGLIESRYSGSLAVSALSVANEVKDIFGEPQAVITLYKDCKLILLPMLSNQLLVGLALERSAVTEDYSLAHKIERLLAESIKSL
jgi:hypothetical protein